MPVNQRLGEMRVARDGQQELTPAEKGNDVDRARWARSFVGRGGLAHAQKFVGPCHCLAGDHRCAIALVASLLPPLDMADWVWWLVQNWQDATPLVWDRLAASLSTEMPSDLVPPLTMSVFVLTTAVGIGMRTWLHQAPIVVSHPILQLSAAMAALLAWRTFSLFILPRRVRFRACQKKPPWPSFLRAQPSAFHR